MSSLFQIRPIEPQDSVQLEALILSVLTELKCVGPGFASADPELQDLFAAYQLPPHQAPDRGYWVIQEQATGRVLGGGGFAPLKGHTGPEKTCELQKVYFHPLLRGRGFGRKLLEKNFQEAQALGYQQMYLETVGVMTNAIAMYEKLGFQRLDNRLGHTGHASCHIFMKRSLEKPALVLA